MGCKVGMGCGLAVTWYLDLMKACLTATSACGAGLHIGLLRCASKMALDFAWSGLGVGVGLGFGFGFGLGLG